jgi:hypothetical protein
LVPELSADIFFVPAHDTITAANKRSGQQNGSRSDPAAPSAAAQEKERFTMKGEMTQKGKEALERFKMESASEVGVTLNKGYNGDLTSRQAGSIGGQMVNLMGPEQQFEFIRSDVKSQEHIRVLTYSVQIGV